MMKLEQAIQITDKVVASVSGNRETRLQIETAWLFIQETLKIDQNISNVTKEK